MGSYKILMILATQLIKRTANGDEDKLLMMPVMHFAMMRCKLQRGNLNERFAQEKKRRGLSESECNMRHWRPVLTWSWPHHLQPYF